MTSCQKNVAEGGIELCMQFFFVQTKILQIAVQFNQETDAGGLVLGKGWRLIKKRRISRRD